MPLLLTLRSSPSVGTPPQLEVAERGLVIGRGQEADWTLPDPSQQLSSRHCRLEFRDGGHFLIDTSTNGTMLNGVRLTAAQRLKPGDQIRVGPHEILVSERAPTAKPQSGALDLSSWSRPAPGAVSNATGRSDVAPVPRFSSGESASREEMLARGLATLVATRARQRRELGVQAPDPLAGNPLTVEPDRVVAALASAPAHDSAIVTAVDAIERHHAATLHAMRGAFRAAIEQFSPAAIARSVDEASSGDARDAALWRTYVARFTGSEAIERSFVETFTRELRQAYERLTSATSSAPRPPS